MSSPRLRPIQHSGATPDLDQLRLVKSPPRSLRKNNRLVQRLSPILVQHADASRGSPELESPASRVARLRLQRMLSRCPESLRGFVQAARHTSPLSSAAAASAAELARLNDETTVAALGSYERARVSCWQAIAAAPAPDTDEQLSFTGCAPPMGATLASSEGQSRTLRRAGPAVIGLHAALPSAKALAEGAAAQGCGWVPAGAGSSTLLPPDGDASGESTLAGLESESTLAGLESELMPLVDVPVITRTSEEPPVLGTGAKGSFRLPTQARINITPVKNEHECQLERPKPIRPQSAGPHVSHSCIGQQ